MVPPTDIVAAAAAEYMGDVGGTRQDLHWINHDGE